MPLAKLNGINIFMGASGWVGIAGQREACLKHDTLERLPLITAPTLVIVGTKDRIVNPHFFRGDSRQNTQCQAS
jgi:pimeloyl-ACP methyl ester carboxylesterase